MVQNHKTTEPHPDGHGDSMTSGADSVKMLQNNKALNCLSFVKKEFFSFIIKKEILRRKGMNTK